VGALSPTHWLIILGVLLLLFGAKRLPETARGIGRSARILKSEMREVTDSVRPDAATYPAPAELDVTPVRPSSTAV
jgi:sec-independent protein translocase protein TatA